MMFMTDHIRGTDRPQTYIQHGKFAMFYSVRLIVAGIVGIVHAIFPWWFKFYTAEQIIKSYVGVSQSGRHDDLLEKYSLGWKVPAPLKEWSP